jgi:succinate dehydrogenase/fumarate reductase cytochrome b subunit
VTSAASVPAELSRRGDVGSMVRVAPALMGLVYPVLVWSAHAISPFALALTLLAPALCLSMAFRLAKKNRYRSATRVAYFGVGAPALYSFLGGWLDSQRWLPYRANGMWVMLWCGLAVLTIFERPGAIEGADVRSEKLAIAHGMSASVITTFAVFHIANHLAGVFGGQVHVDVMRHLRLVYRQPVVEAVLITCVLFQVASGYVLLLRRTRRPAKGWIEMLQNASGGYLMLFFASHISAVFRTRYLHHIDTNWAWLTADNLLTDPWSVRLVPYYFLGVLALAVHGGCGLRRVLSEHGKQRMADHGFLAVALAGGLGAFVIMTALILGSMHNTVSSGTSAPMSVRPVAVDLQSHPRK